MISPRTLTLRQRRPWALCLCALLLAGCGSAGAAQVRSSGRAADRPSHTAIRPGAIRPGATRPARKARTAPALERRLLAALNAGGAHSGAIVEDVSDRAVLFAQQPDVERPPASVEKLYTSVAALNVLGPRARFPTTVLGRGTLGPGGVWHGNLYLRGGGDPTLGDGAWNRAYADGYGPTASQLAVQLRRDGIRRVRGHIFADESLFDSDRGGPATHNQPDIPDYGGELSALVYDHGMTAPGMSPAVFAAHELALTLRARGVRVAAAGRTQVTPAGAKPLARVQSPPLSVLIRLMDVPSDDLIADMLAKQLGARMLGRGTLAAGASEIRQTVSSDYGINPVIFDGSGLDRADRTSPAQIVSLLRIVWGTPTGNLLYAALPIVGEQGTVKGIGAHTRAQGNCVAKTGTLDNVTNLAGYCTTRDHHTLAFALMIDGPPNYVAASQLGKAVAAIANY